MRSYRRYLFQIPGKSIIPFITILTIVTGCQPGDQDVNKTIDLSGIWKFQLDSGNVGISEKWFNKDLTDTVELPGTTDENKKGIFLDERAEERLSRVWYWKGAAWYQKEVNIPEAWAGKNVRLLLERTKDTYVWLDDKSCGYENTLSAPQYFDLSKDIDPGKHQITVLVDNAKLPPVGPSHAVDERTQTNWNGIIGKIELQMTDPVWLDEVYTYPDISNNRVKVLVKFGNITGQLANGTLSVKANSWNTEAPREYGSVEFGIRAISSDKVVELTYDFDQEVPLWNEFDPSLIRLTMDLSVSTGEQDFVHSMEVDFGMREFKRDGKYLMLNGERIYLRGRLDCANYPLTGYPPMDKSTWIDLFKQLKSYGINHWRYHSWFPPKAALQAADEVGVYLQPELPNKRSGMDNKSMEEEAVRKLYNADYLEVDFSRVNMTLKEYLKKEGELIFKHFGNHPSFMMFTLGNELGRNEGMFELIDYFKKIDPRRLYAQGSNNMHWEPSVAEGDDFWVTAKVAGKLGVRGSFATVADIRKPHIEHEPPSTMHTYTEAIEDIDVPVIAHETGQFQVSPDFDDIPKFTGVTRARNYEMFRERFKNSNLLDQADDFVAASGKLAVICYREDIEAALRTPDFAGFQLLDIQDFPGQGTALVGILNAFMEPKGLISPEEWRQFCSEVVPLLKMEKYTWTNDETFSGDVEVANYGPRDFKPAQISWVVTGPNEKTYGQGKLSAEVSRGNLVPVGGIKFDLASIENAQKLNVSISIEGTAYKNKYDIWVYPRTVDTSVSQDILVSEKLDRKTIDHLENGGKAIIFPKQDELTHCIPGAFQTDFWCYPMFLRAAKRSGVDPAPGSLGFICDPDHPLLNKFPTEFHSNWQWWHLVKNSKPIILDDAPEEYRPLIQTIDNFDRHHKLGMVFETKFNKGSALICSIDLLHLQDKPEARQFYHSILNYVRSNDFAPESSLDVDLLKRILPK